MSPTATLILRKGADRRLRQGHCWVFSNEVDTKKTPLKQLQPGGWVDVLSSSGDYLGSGFANPHTLISVRLLLLHQTQHRHSKQNAQTTSESDTEPVYDPETLLMERLSAAYKLRSSLFDAPWYRLVHAEGDLLPGLIVDRYDSVLMVQITTAGLEHHRKAICDHLAGLSGCKTVHLANRVASRELENLSLDEETPVGQLPDQLTVNEQQCEIKVASGNSQKTGWFYDHRDNRALTANVARGKRVLDVFCYVGSWSITAAVAGADSVVAIDSSDAAITGLRDNAELNGVADKIRPIVADAIEALKALQRDGEMFDVVILDPPAFIKRKKDYDKGVQHYDCLLYTSPSPRDRTRSRMPSSA